MTEVIKPTYFTLDQTANLSCFFVSISLVFFDILHHFKGCEAHPPQKAPMFFANVSSGAAVGIPGKCPDEPAISICV